MMKHLSNNNNNFDILLSKNYEKGLLKYEYFTVSFILLNFRWSIKYLLYFFASMNSPFVISFLKLVNTILTCWSEQKQRNEWRHWLETTKILKFVDTLIYNLLKQACTTRISKVKSALTEAQRTRIVNKQTRIAPWMSTSINESSSLRVVIALATIGASYELWRSPGFHYCRHLSLPYNGRQKPTICWNKQPVET